MVSAFDSGSSDMDSSAGQGHCVVLLGKILKVAYSILSLTLSNSYLADDDI